MTALPDGPSFRLRALHIFTLCAYAFSGPILTALSQQKVFLHDQEIGWSELAAVLIVLLLGIPSCCVLLDRAACYPRRFSGRARNAVLFVLSGLVCMTLLRPCAKVPFLAERSSAWMFSLAVSLPVAWLVARYYERLSALRTWLTISALGMVIFPLSFVWQIEHARQLKLGEDSRRQTHIQNPVPVIVIVFDEFSGTTLMDEQLQIDARHYPNFARLASQSTWYRQATTVHTRTDVAVPSILSGQFPVTQRGPLEANYPGNLLQTIQASGSYDMAVFEPVSRLCPESMTHERPAIPASRIQRAAKLIQTLVAVYPRLILPGDTPISFPVIPKAWFGMPDKPSVSQRHLLNGLFHYQYTRHRDAQQDHFLDCLRPTTRPLFGFFHVLLPHFSWEYFPSGRRYVDDSYEPSSPEGGLGDLGETWPSDKVAVLRNEHRYLLQVGYTDRFIGRLLDRLQATGLLDRCLLIVTADHGVSFRPSRSRRVPDAENIADIMSVPLFIKFPGQTAGRVDDRNVESVDLYPTIAGELGIELAEPVDGAPVSSEIRRPRKTLYFENGMTVVEPTIPRLEAAVQQRLKSFGSGSREHPPRSAASRPDWHGRALRDFSTTDDTSPDSPKLCLTSPLLDAIRGNVTSLLVSGFVTPQAKSPPEVLLAAGGIIRDSYQTSSVTDYSFCCLLPESAAQVGPVEVELLLVKPMKSGRPQLVRLRKWTVHPSK